MAFTKVGFDSMPEHVCEAFILFTRKDPDKPKEGDIYQCDCGRYYKVFLVTPSYEYEFSDRGHGWGRKVRSALLFPYSSPIKE